MKRTKYITPETEVVSSLLEYTILVNSPLKENVYVEEGETNVELGANESKSLWDEE